MVLLKEWLHSTCLMPAAITSLTFKGSQLIMRLKCQEGHEAEWKSQPNYNHYSVGNKYQRLAQFFDLAGIQWISKTSFYAIQNRYLYGIVNRNYIAVLEDMKQAKLVDLGGGKRCDSSGHNAKITKSRSS